VFAAAFSSWACLGWRATSLPSLPLVIATQLPSKRAQVTDTCPEGCPLCSCRLPVGVASSI
jgi:hypothetical protein